MPSHTKMERMKKKKKKKLPLDAKKVKLFEEGFKGAFGIAKLKRMKKK